MKQYFNACSRLEPKENRLRDIGYFKLISLSIFFYFIFFTILIQVYNLSPLIIAPIMILNAFLFLKEVSSNKYASLWSVFYFGTILDCLDDCANKIIGEKISVIKKVTIKDVEHQLHIKNNLQEIYVVNGKIHNESGEFAIVSHFFVDGFGARSITGSYYFQGLNYDPSITSLEELKRQKLLQDKVSAF